MGIAILLTFVSVFLITWVAFYGILSRKAATAVRIRSIMGDVAQSPSSQSLRLSGHSSSGQSPRAQNPSGLFGGLLRRRGSGQASDELRERRSVGRATDRKRTFSSELDVWLRRADITLSKSDFVVRWLVIVFAFTVLLGLTPARIAAILIPPGAALGTAMYLRLRMQARLRRFNDGLYDLLILVSNALRSGNSFMQALHLVTTESTGPIQEEVGRIEAEMQMGVSMEDALDRAGARVGSPDFDLIVTAIGIQRQVGGNLAEVLERIAETIGERVKLKREVKALTAQGRMSAAIFMGLPAAVGVLLYMLNPSYISVLFQSTVGWVLLAVAAGGQLLGFVFIRKIVQVEL